MDVINEIMEQMQAITDEKGFIGYSSMMKSVLRKVLESKLHKKEVELKNWKDTVVDHKLSKEKTQTENTELKATEKRLTDALEKAIEYLTTDRINDGVRILTEALNHKEE